MWTDRCRSIEDVRSQGQALLTAQQIIGLRWYGEAQPCENWPIRYAVPCASLVLDPIRGNEIYAQLEFVAFSRTTIVLFISMGCVLILLFLCEILCNR